MADSSGIQTLALRLFQVSQPLWEAAAQAVHVIVLTDEYTSWCGIHGRNEILFHLRHARTLLQRMLLHVGTKPRDCGLVGPEICHVSWLLIRILPGIRAKAVVLHCLAVFFHNVPGACLVEAKAAV